MSLEDCLSAANPKGLGATRLRTEAMAIVLGLKHNSTIPLKCLLPSLSAGWQHRCGVTLQNNGKIVQALTATALRQVECITKVPGTLGEKE